MQKMRDLAKTDSKKEISCLKWTKYIDRKVCVNLNTVTEKLKSVVYPYWNSLYLKDFEVDLQLTEYQSLWTKRVYLLT